MKILFLDVDGVLNTKEGRLEWIRNHNNLLCLEDGLMQNLARIVKETDCKIVLHSSWRHMTDAMRALYKKFENYDLKLHDIGKGIDARSAVQDYLNSNNVIKFAMVDDLRDRIVLSDKGRFFLTDDRYGLNNAISNKIIEFLNDTNDHCPKTSNTDRD